MPVSYTHLDVYKRQAWDNRKRADISYQLLVYSFADGNGDKVGDLPGLTRRLDYIDALGASAVWLSPIHPAASYHGYDVLDYEAVSYTPLDVYKRQGNLLQRHMVGYAPYTYYCFQQVYDQDGKPIQNALVDPLVSDICII